jgi:hypothetical protein
MTTPEPMTVQDVTRLLHAAVEAYGADWVDPNAVDDACMNTYVLDGKTRHCIVGWVLTNHGYDLTHISNGTQASAALYRLHASVYAKGASRFDTVMLLEKAQNLQDLGTPWGEVVTQALHTHKNPAKSEEPNTNT